MFNRNLFIVFEGLSGSGKSTIGKELALRINAEYLKAPLPPFDDLRSYIDSNVDNQTRFLFYLMSLSDLSNQIKQKLEHKTVIADKYTYTTAVYNKLRGVNTEILDKLDLIKPDFVFFIDLDEDTRRKRLANREGFSIDFTIERIAKENSVKEAILQYPVIRIINDKDIDTTIEEIISILKK